MQINAVHPRVPVFRSGRLDRRRLCIPDGAVAISIVLDRASVPMEESLAAGTAPRATHLGRAATRQTTQVVAPVMADLRHAFRQAPAGASSR